VRGCVFSLLELSRFLINKIFILCEVSQKTDAVIGTSLAHTQPTLEDLPQAFSPKAEGLLRRRLAPGFGVLASLVEINKVSCFLTGNFIQGMGEKE
jgi:hypothetical protein